MIINKVNKKWYVADFETKTEKFYKENGYTEVWLYAISDSEGKIIDYGFNIKQFFTKLKELSNSIIYFHNLKFDGSFILNYLINNNFEYKEELKPNDNKGYSTLITEMGLYFQITINFKRGCQVIINDSLKLLPFSVAKIAKDFNLPMSKGKIDYDNYTINDETLNYVFNDVSIVALALNEIKQNGMVNMTTASCAYNNYLKTNQYADVLFPHIEENLLIEWRGAYRGGRTQVNPLYENVILHNVKRYDINSMYPSIMYNFPLPCGEPIKCDTIGNYKFELYKITTHFKLKENHLPTLLKKNTMYADMSYYIESELCETLWISNIDYELLQRHYNIDYVVFNEIYGFETTNILFKDYIDYWYEIKNTTKGAKKLVAKTMLNSLYGKFGSKLKGCKKIPKLENNILKYDKSEITTLKEYYLPIAIAITSYAHKLIDDAIIATGIDNFVYCDTDSVHTLGDLPNDMIDNKELGKFKFEANEVTSKYIRQKTYAYSEIENGEIKYNVVCAGMNNEIKESLIENGELLFDIFTKGLKISGKKLIPKQVKGGCILCETSFEIKE